MNTIQDFLLSKGMIIDISSYNVVALNNMLHELYASVHSSKGGEYSVASLLTLGAGLNRHIPAHNVISDPEFMSSMGGKQGNDRSAHHPPLHQH